MSAGTVHPREQQRETRLHGRRRGKSDPSHIPHAQLNQHTVHRTCKHQPHAAGTETRSDNGKTPPQIKKDRFPFLIFVALHTPSSLYSGTITVCMVQ